MLTPPAHTFQLNSLSELELHHVQAELVTYRGRHAVRLVEPDESAAYDDTIAILSGSDFKDGVIEAVCQWCGAALLGGERSKTRRNAGTDRAVDWGRY